jgi:predicted nucleic acid-binding protein
LPFIAYYEFLRGLKVGKPKKYSELKEFVDQFNVLSTTKKTAEILSNLRIKYDASGEKLPLADLLIASQIIENQLVLVTKDKDFERIKELKKIIF